jgi:hypothetical protein
VVDLPAPGSTPGAEDIVAAVRAKGITTLTLPPRTSKGPAAYNYASEDDYKHPCQNGQRGNAGLSGGT